MKRIILAILLVLSASIANADSYNDALAALNREDYSEALRIFRLLADQGNDYAQHDLGVMYDKGQGVPQDYMEAIRWYRQAAEQGFIPSQMILGYMYNQGQGVPIDYVASVHWFRRAAEQGESEAQAILGIMY